MSRIASNFFRFGSFEIFKGPSEDGDHDGRAGPSAGNEALRQQLLDHILLYYPDISSSPARYEEVFKEVVRRTAYLAARWQCVGFVHGVLNTDNMSLMGLTIDYGPFGFMEHFDPQYVPNGSDTSARYSYQEQPAICKWNLAKLAEALGSLLSKASAEGILGEYDAIYEHYYQALVGAKFGFMATEADTSLEVGHLFSNVRVNDELPPPRCPSGLLLPEDLALVSGFFTTLSATGTDFTDAFVALTEYVEALGEGAASASVQAAQGAVLVDKLVSRSATPASVVQSMRRKLKIHRLNMQPGQIQQLFSILQTATPAQLRNMFSGAPVEAIRDEVTSEKRKLDMLVAASTAVKKYEALSGPVKAKADREHWQQWCDVYTARVAQLCSSPAECTRRAAIMRAQNPTFVLRSWLAQDAIKLAEDGADYSGVRTLLQMLEDPYNPSYSTFKHEPTASCGVQQGGKRSFEEVDGGELSGLQKKYVGPSPEWADSLICTCSS